MAFHKELTKELQHFINEQKIFFTGTAPSEGKINLSPKGLDSFRILGPLKVMWLNLTGSGNETAAHLLENGRITIMFCSFEGSPQIVRLYGKGKVIHPRDADWNKFISSFANYKTARQLIIVDLDMIQTSCGFGVPLYNFAGEREQLATWANKKSRTDIEDYWKNKNRISLDGKPTGI